jgi:hypothetical protein
MRQLLTALMLIPCIAFADNFTPGGSVYYSNDTAGNEVRKIAAELWFDGKEDTDLADQFYGVRVSDLMYSNDLREHSGKAIEFLVDKRNTDTWWLGSAGVGEVDDHTYIVGDMSFLHFLNRNALVSGGVYSDIIDSPEGLLNGVDVYGAYIGGEIYNDIGGLTATINRKYMSDDNTRDILVSKGYLNLPLGFHVYLANETFTGEKWSPYYWSPEDFSRTDVGIGFRMRWRSVLFSGAADIGDTVIDGAHDDAKSWYFNIESPRNKKMVYGMRSGQDLSPFNYTFRYISIYARIGM